MSISCILYFFSNFGKSGVQSFKRCSIWSWNEEVIVVWRWLCKVERKCCSQTPFCYCWTRFWSTLWSSNYAYHIHFWSSRSQESNASNGVRIWVEMKKLWSFEDNRAKHQRKFRSRAPISKGVLQLRNHPLAHECHFPAPIRPFRSCEMGYEIPILLPNDFQTSKWL